MRIYKLSKYLIWLILEPLMAFVKKVYKQMALSYHNPTLRIGNNVSASGTQFGKFNYVSYNSKIHNSQMDSYSYVGNGCFIDNTKIGKFTCIGPGVHIGLGVHPSSTFVSVHPIFYSVKAQVGVTFSDKNYFEEYKPVTIGNDVWIGANAIINGGLVIGDGVIVASGAVVTKDVAPYTIVGGVPAKPIKMRFDPDRIKLLLELKWWDRDAAWLRENFRLMHDVNNAELFKEASR